MEKTLKNETVFVIGGSEGIGFAVAAEFASHGAKTVVFSRNREKLVAASKSIQETTGQTVETVPLDITDFSACEQVLGVASERFGVPDFLINCAGFARPGYIDQLDVGHFRKMMELNYMGTVHVVKALAPQMIKAKKGHIVTTSSMAGFIGLFGYTGYCGSKYAVMGFSEALRRELKPFGIRVSVLCPPNTKTPGLDEENRHKPSEVLATEEKVKVVEPEFVAKVLMKGLAKNKFIIVPTSDGTLAYYLSRYSPVLLDQFVKRPYPK